ncbi:aconitate hydratase AcnA [Roseospira marina]|uniref:Aconitate hydratase n=1 Tax=Roseospira marina TaxID=140057 RepID=A0A5M6IH78_9PROT|nr:aconitate hydratase AcnA [Roseospira marina]KAA5607119.1 aconitate hydratase AcnA [Roseospira marina]MBB4312685.1 aconitate hydratase [Roseospira marina]MBB5086542.1 aconitate hydratase [Roseospira marina]
MGATGQDTLKARRTLSVGDAQYDYFSLADAGLGDISRLPFSLKVLLENMLRHEDGRTVTIDDVKAVAAWLETRSSTREIAYRPARVLMQDFTGVPAVVDLAAMREAMTALGGDPERINPLSPVDLVIDHSVMVDHYASADALERNMDLEFERNGERYAFLRWGQKAFDNFRVVPPGVGICHQVNLEYLARTVWSSEDQTGKMVAYPDTLVGTDSHTTMVNGLGVLGWGVGGIEAEAAMLGQPVSMLIPEVIGFKLTGSLKEGTTATDLVLTVTQMLRAKGVVGKFVEYFGPGLASMPLADRATIANMAPEYGATCGIFPIDSETLRYLRDTGRSDEQVALVEAYAKAQGMWRDDAAPEPVYTDTLELDLGDVEPSLAGPRRPQDRIALSGAAGAFAEALKDMAAQGEPRTVPVEGADYSLSDGDVVIAAITSCTNTSNPSVLLAAGLLAKNAVAKGLTRKPWVKTSLAPGSQVVTDYLAKAGLQDPLNALGFNIAGYGCTTCIGNSGPLDGPIADAIDDNGLVAGAVLSGNRNFEGRISPQVRANYLASPPLVVAYAIAGTMAKDLTTEPLGEDTDGNPVYLKDIWPSAHDVAEAVTANVKAEMFNARYGNVFDGPAQWKSIQVAEGKTYEWAPGSTYVQNPPYFEGMDMTPKPPTDIVNARPLAVLADSVTTDHISPAGSIKGDSPAGHYLQGHQVPVREFNSYGSRRGNHEVMMRGTFANIRIKNEMVPGSEGGVTKHLPEGTVMPIYDAAMAYKGEGVPLVVVAGKEYGTGSSRDWAAKGTVLLGVKAVIVESFERIHRSNLVGMGVLPLQFKDGATRKTLGLDGSETFTITGVADITPRQDVTVTITRADGSSEEVVTTCRIDTLDELEYFRNGGILQYVLRSLAAA